MNVGKKLLIAAILMLLGYIINEYDDIIVGRYYDWAFVPAQVSDGRSFEILIRNGTYETIKEETWNTKLLANTKSVISYLRSPKISVYEYGEYALLLHYAYQYAKVKDDIEIKELVKKKFDKVYIVNGGGKIIRNDQVAYGNVAIDLYLDTRDNKYKQFADLIYQRLDSINKKEGMILYNGGRDEQRVDGIGLICPFLFYYASTFNNDHSLELASRTANEYIKWGTDPETGVPSKSYGINTHIKRISPNWGRGVSWYLIGTEMLTEMDSICRGRLLRLDNLLLSNQSRLFNQYYDEKGLPDMSSTIPVLYHLISSGYIKMNKNELTQIIAPFCDNEGILRYCSPVVSSHIEVNKTISNLFCQGLLLYLLTMCK